MNQIPLIDITNLTFSYNHQVVLQNIYLSYHNSQFLGIIGQNGGGKTTLIRLILNLIPHNLPIRLNLSLQEIGYVPQHIHHHSHFPISTQEVVLMGRVKNFRHYNSEDKDALDFTLDRLKIAHLRHKDFSSLSGGQKQKALLARSICSNPKLLILDEPTASIDSQSTEQIFDLLQDLHAKGMGIIMVCHDLELLLCSCTHIASIQKTLTLYSLPQERELLLEHFGCKHHLKGQCDV